MSVSHSGHFSKNVNCIATIFKLWKTIHLVNKDFPFPLAKNFFLYRRPRLRVTCSWLPDSNWWKGSYSLGCIILHFRAVNSLHFIWPLIPLVKRVPLIALGLVVGYDSLPLVVTPTMESYQDLGETALEFSLECAYSLSFPHASMDQILSFLVGMHAVDILEHHVLNNHIHSISWKAFHTWGEFFFWHSTWPIEIKTFRQWIFNVDFNPYSHISLNATMNIAAH